MFKQEMKLLKVENVNGGKAIHLWQKKKELWKKNMKDEALAYPLATYIGRQNKSVLALNVYG